jgi:hypothetical protein
MDTLRLEPERRGACHPDLKVLEMKELELVDQTFVSSNPLVAWLRQLDQLRRAV